MSDDAVWQEVRALGSRVASLETAHAVSLNDRGHVDKRFDMVQRQISDLSDMIRRVGWFLGALVASALLGGMLKWIVEGGLAGAS